MQPVFMYLGQRPGVWRVDGISKIYLDNSKPRVQICFAKIKDDQIDNPYKNSSIEKKGIDGKRYINFNLPYSAILWFTVGSLWKNGKKIGSPKLEGVITVDTRQGTTRRLNEKLELDGVDYSFIPHKFYSFGGNSGSYGDLKGANYEILPISSGSISQYLIIPHSELYRFYIGASSRLCNAVIMGEVDKYVDFNRSIAGRSPVLIAHARLSLLERFVLLRALCEEDAMASLNYTRLTLKAERLNDVTSSRERTSMIRAIFPFKDITSLSVSGKKVCIREKADDVPAVWAILAMQIHTCSRSVSFDDATIMSSTVYRNPNPREEHDGVDPIKTHQLNRFDVEELDLDDSPSDETLRRLALLYPESRFPRVRHIDYALRHVDGTEDSSGVRMDVLEANEPSSINEGDYREDSKGTKGVDMSIDEQSVGRSLSDFLCMIKILRNLCRTNGWVVTTIQNHSGIISEGEKISVFPAMPKRFNWHMIKSNPSRPRQVVCAKIKLEENKELYLIEMELREGESGRSTAVFLPLKAGSIIVRDFNNLLKLTAYRHCWPHKDAKFDEREKLLSEKIFSKANIDKINHLSGIKSYTAEDLDRWAKEIFNKIDTLKIYL
jgi:hypothetical protein